MKKLFKRILSFLIYLGLVLFPMIDNLIKNLPLFNDLKKNNTANKFGLLQKTKNPNLISTDILREKYKETLEIKDKLENKAKSIVFCITITITLIINASKIITDIAKECPYWFLILFIIIFCTAVFYMMFAGLSSIKVLVHINRINVINLDKLSNEEELRKEYDICISENIARNIIRNNYIFTSYECIRNSLFLLFGLLILSFLSA